MSTRSDIAELNGMRVDEKGGMSVSIWNRMPDIWLMWN